MSIRVWAYGLFLVRVWAEHRAFRSFADGRFTDGRLGATAVVAAYHVVMGTALVTGATSGIGLEFCWQLAADRHNLVMVARDRARLEATAERIRQVAAVSVEVLPADLADKDDLGRVCRRLSLTVSGSNFPSVEDGDGRVRAVGLLVNAAGFGLGKPFLDDSLEHQEYGLDAMVRAVMATCHSAGRAMRERGSGAIINVGSVAADTGMGTYSAHKAWVRSFSEGLAEELRGSGVTVTATMPGLVHTEFHDRSDMDLSATPEFIWCDADIVVAQSLDAARRGKTVVVPTLRYRTVNVAQRYLPNGLIKAITRAVPHT